MRAYNPCSSLCTNLGAAEKFSKSHLETAEVKELINNAKFFYMGGFFLTHGIESALVVAKQAKQNNAVSGIFFEDLCGALEYRRACIQMAR